MPRFSEYLVAVKAEETLRLEDSGSGSQLISQGVPNRSISTPWSNQLGVGAAVNG